MAKLIILAFFLSTVDQFSNKRQLLLYADNANNKQLIEQQKLLKDEAANLKERDITIKVYLHSTASNQFKSKYIKSDFTVILIGKDGGEKLRSSKVLTPEQLYAIVDAMPMRKQEMRH